MEREVIKIRSIRGKDRFFQQEEGKQERKIAENKRKREGGTRQRREVNKGKNKYESRAEQRRGGLPG